MSYDKALTGIYEQKMSQRREELCKNYFEQILQPSHKLNCQEPSTTSLGLKVPDEKQSMYSLKKPLIPYVGP